MSDFINIILMDIFGVENFRNEIIWKRTQDVGAFKIRKTSFANQQDSIFFYSKENKNKFNIQIIENTFDLSKFKLNDNDGKGAYYWDNLNKCSKGTIERLTEANEIKIRKSGKYNYKRYLERVKHKGSIIGSIWDDINRTRIPEYPTQKPEALLERIILASTN